jgi:hypothetical protein
MPAITQIIRRLIAAAMLIAGPALAQNAPTLTNAPRNTPAVRPTPGISPLSSPFVRDQAILGALVYGPSFAATVTNDPVAFAAAYIVAGGGAYLAANQLNRDFTITPSMSAFSTSTAIRGGLAGLALAYGFDGDRKMRAGGIFLGSIAGTTTALLVAKHMTDGEAAASTFGADFTALTGLAATHIASSTPMSARHRAPTLAFAGLVGYPLGYLYANNASYHVTRGDVTTLWATAGIGATLGGAFVASGHPSSASVATALAVGGIAGVIAGDRLLVRRYDHAPFDGQLVVAGSVAGGLMGAGIAALTGASHERVSPAMAVLTAAGGIGGLLWTEHYLGNHADAGRRLSRIEISPSGILAAAAGARGTYSLLHITF